MERLKDTLLYSRSLFSRLTGKKSTLVAGIFFVGAVDMLFPLFIDDFRNIFFDQAGVRPGRVFLALLIILIIGVLDVAFFSIPLSDLFRVFKKEKEHVPMGDIKPIIMKVYIMAHLLVKPVQILLYYAFFKDLNMDNVSTIALYAVAILWLVMIPVWFSAIISRGINTVYRFQPLFKRLVFPVVFLWGFLVGEALNYVIEKWVMKLFVA